VGGLNPFFSSSTSGNGYRVPPPHPEFRVVESERRNGKIFFSIECDSLSAGIIIHFLKVASEFAHRLDYLAEAEAKSRDREAERIAGEPERKARRAETLKLYDSMAGVPPSRRIARVREILAARGQTLRYGEVEADINLAREDERRELESGLRAPVDCAGVYEMPIVSAAGALGGLSP
jgi:hypothetical protein